MRRDIVHDDHVDDDHVDDDDDVDDDDVDGDASVFCVLSSDGTEG